MIKKTLTVLCFLALHFLVMGQGLFLGTYDKNSLHNGTVFSINRATDKIDAVLELTSDNIGFLADNAFIEVDTGVFIGAMYSGGQEGAGTMVRIDIKTNTMQVVFSFEPSKGMLPTGRLLSFDANNLLGITTQGGLYGYGVIYKYNYKTNTYTVLYDFGQDPSIGTTPCERIVFDKSSGVLFGVATAGGTHNNGVLYSFDINSMNYKGLYNFNFPGILYSAYDGALTYLDEGVLLGSFSGSGVNKVGELFTYTLKDSTYSVIYEFDSITGRPVGIPLKKDSIIYCQTITDSLGYAKSNIVIINLSNNDTSIVPIQAAFGTGAYSLAEIGIINDSMLLCFGSSNALYHGGGVYTLNAKSKEITPLYFFSALTGYRPIRVCPTKFGKGYYATNRAGGSNGNGTFLVLDSAFGTKAVYSFNASTTGKIIGNKVVEAGGKKLYVLTREGGVRNEGTLLQIDYPTLSYKPVFHFGGVFASGETVPHLPKPSSLLRVSDTLLAFATGDWNNTISLYSTVSNTILQYFSFDHNTNRQLDGKLMFTNGKVYGWLGFYIDQFYAKTLYEYDIVTNQVKGIFDLDSLEPGSFSNGGEIIVIGNKTYCLLTVEEQNNESIAILEYDLNKHQKNLYKQSTFISGYNTYGGLTLINDSLLVFLTCNDNTFNFGKVGVFNTNTKNFEWYALQGNLDGTNPVGTPFYKADESALYFFCTRSGLYDKGSLLKLDINSKSFQKIVDLGSENYYTSMDKVSKDVTFINEYPLSSNYTKQSNKGRYFTISPNPANETTSIFLSQQSNGYIEIYDAKGTLLEKRLFEDIDKLFLDVNELSPGSYIVKLYAGGGIHSEKLVIAH
jgi:uncharacterized repeat protein (TIGR03803 family)